MCVSGSDTDDSAKTSITAALQLESSELSSRRRISVQMAMKAGWFIQNVSLLKLARMRGCMQPAFVLSVPFKLCARETSDVLVTAHNKLFEI